jgi:hypothetical protein
MAAVVLVGVISLWVMHRRFAGPSLEDDVKEAIIRKMIEDPAFNLTWAERVTWLCIIVGVVLLLILCCGDYSQCLVNAVPVKVDL